MKAVTHCRQDILHGPQHEADYLDQTCILCQPHPSSATLHQQVVITTGVSTAVQLDAAALWPVHMLRLSVSLSVCLYTG